MVGGGSVTVICYAPPSPSPVPDGCTGEADADPGKHEGSSGEQSDLPSCVICYPAGQQCLGEGEYFIIHYIGINKYILK